MGWEVIDVFCEKQQPHWIMFRKRQSLAVEIIYLALFRRASWLLINEYQVESKTVLENTC